nr:MAG TPA: hypothetical protein [Caudoviricetes sp.]
MFRAYPYFVSLFWQDKILNVSCCSSLFWDNRICIGNYLPNRKSDQREDPTDEGSVS